MDRLWEIVIDKSWNFDFQVSLSLFRSVEPPHMYRFFGVLRLFVIFLFIKDDLIVVRYIYEINNM